MASAEASLRRLQTDYIDLYILHFWDNDTALSESLRAMDDLVRQGKVRYVGVSNYQSWQAVQALWTADQLGLDPIRSVQLRYSFLRREPEAEAFPAAIEHGLAVTPYWLLEAGVFTGKYRRGEKPDTDSRFAHRPGMADMFMNDNHVGRRRARAGHRRTDRPLTDGCGHRVGASQACHHVRDQLAPAVSRQVRANTPPPTCGSPMKTWPSWTSSARGRHRRHGSRRDDAGVASRAAGASRAGAIV